MNDTDKRAIEEMASDIAQSGMLDSRSRCRIVAEELYFKGYSKQKEAEWISVEERLPDNNTERVLVFLMDDDFTKPIGENKIDTDRFVDGKWVRWSRFVTHWMPLPEPPKGD